MSIEDPNEAFKRYLAEHEGKPIDPAAAEAAKYELRQDEERSSVVHRDEPDRSVVAASYPEGDLFKTNIPERELPKAILELENARKTIIDNLTAEHPVDLFADPKNMALEEAIDQKTAPLSESVHQAFVSIKKYMDIDPATSLYDLPELIKDFLVHLNAVQSHLHNNT